MRRFLAFAYDHYYPCGGKGDFVGDFDTVTEATNAEMRREFMDVLDTETGEWIEVETQSRWQPYTAEEEASLMDKVAGLARARVG